ncbi:hypothetical protein C0431_04425 [bacterium]|nr:hypothetical protein [bacterium]
MITTLALCITLTKTQDAPDPYLLDIGRKGTVTARMGYTDTRSGKPSTPDEIAAAADSVQFILVGESHATPSHHQAQADIIRALVKRGRLVTVGMEMVTRDRQMQVNGLSSGMETIEEFEVSSDWKNTWGHNFNAYRPVFEAIRDHKLRLTALNVPREMVRKASRESYEAFTEFEKKWVPYMDLTNSNHEKVVSALIGGHPLNGSGFNMLAGQVTWDIGMAKTALDWRRDWPYKKNIMVILAGSGHVMYDQGINYRLKQMDGTNSISVVCVSDEPNRKVSRGLADYVFVGELPPQTGTRTQ